MGTEMKRFRVLKTCFEGTKACLRALVSSHNGENFQSLKIVKSLTNVLPRFNVHLFLTRGTYSIKISY